MNGERNILLSQHPGLLEGFSIDKVPTLESMVSKAIATDDKKAIGCVKCSRRFSCFISETERHSY